MRLAALAVACLATGCVEPACPAGDPAGAQPAARFAVVSSDYSSTAIGLLDAEGALVEESWLDSGTVTPRIVAPLSGDVVLPSAPLGACALAVIDRLGTDVVTVLDPCAGGVIGQLDVGASFAANPQDVVPLPDGRALVTRFEPNGDPAAPPSERGNDALLLELDPPRRVGRIDLAALGAGDALARPGRGVALDAGAASRALLGLARLSRRFDEAGPGAVVALDVETEAVTLLDLAPLASCDVVAAVPGEASRALVRCGGRPFTTEEERRPSAGVVLVELEPDGALREVARWAAADHPGAPVYDTAVIPLGGTRATAWIPTAHQDDLTKTTARTVWTVPRAPIE